MATTNTFDFEQFNALMKNANTGLRLYLAEQLLQDAQSVMVRFRSPLVRDITDIVDELHQLRDDNKKYLAKRNNTTPADVDNPENLATSSTDVQVEIDRVKQAKDAGNI